MYEISVRIVIAAPIGEVFDAISDHERFFHGPGIDRCVVTKDGATEKNGLGAVREVDANGHHFVEEVVRFERPTRFDYLVKSVRRGGRQLPMKHEAGWLEFSETHGGTRVEWRSRFRIAIPVVGRLIEKAMGPKASGAFQKLLAQSKRDIESARGSTAAE